MPALPDVIHLPGPTVPPPDKKTRSGSETRARPTVMRFRLTGSEHADMQEAARAAGVDLGAYARQQALAAPESRGNEPHDTNRPHIVPFRVTDAERDEIEVAASRAGLSTGSYIRARALRRPVTLTTRRPPVEKAELARLLGLLGNIASNVNQIARQLNSDGVPEIVATRDAVAAVQDAAEQIIDSMGRTSRPRVAR